MANYGIYPVKMQAQFNDALNKAGVVTTSGVTSVPNGALVIDDVTSALPENIYGVGDINLFNFKRFATNDKGAFYVLDSAEVPEVTDGVGNVYKVGDFTLSRTYAPTRVLRYRQLFLGDRIEIFDGNITGSAVGTTNKFLIPTNNSFNFTADSSAAASGLCLKIIASYPLNAGITNCGTKYLAQVISL